MFLVSTMLEPGLVRQSVIQSEKSFKYRLRSVRIFYEEIIILYVLYVHMCEKRTHAATNGD